MRSSNRALLALALAAAVLFCAGTADAAVVLRTQRGSLTMGGAPLVGAVYTQTVNLGSAVTANRSYVIGSTRTNLDTATERVMMQLNGAGTQLIFTSYSNNANLAIEWEVVEFTDVTVQRGTVNFPTTGGTRLTINVPIAAVNLAKAVILVSERSTEGTAAKDENWTIRARYTSTTNIELSRLASDSTTQAAWQAIEFNDTTTTVYSGLSTIANGSTFVLSGAFPAVDLARSFLLLTRRSDPLNKGKERNYMVGGRFNSTTQLRFDREFTEGPVNISWFVVQLGPESAVDSGTVTLGVGVAVANITIAGTDPNQTMTIVSTYGGGADVNKLKSDSVTSQLSSGTNLHFERSATESVVNGVWFIVQYYFVSCLRETADLDGDGRIDAIKMTSFEPLNDNFTGLTVVVAGYTVTGYDTGATLPAPFTSPANDNIFYVLLTEQALPLYTGDTDATPGNRFSVNTSLRGTTSNLLVRIESTLRTPLDRAKPVLMKAEWKNGGSCEGVDAFDTVEMSFSEPTIATAVLMTDIRLPVTNDFWDTSTVTDQGPAITIIIDLMGQPRLSPGGTYSSASTTAGSPTGVYINVPALPLRTPFLDLVGNTALNQTPATAVDLLPGGPAVIGICWNDCTMAPKVWDLGTQDVLLTFTTATTVPPLVLSAVNSGNVRQKFDALCSASAPSGWTVAAAAGLNQFEMKIDASTPLDATYELDLGTGPKTIVGQFYSGFEKQFDLYFATPTDLNVGAGVQQSITVTIIASQD